MFRDRREAGQRLAEHLVAYRSDPNVVVVGLPRGGVPVAREVATVLGAPLDVIIVRKLGVPRQPELAMGAIGEGGARYVDEDLVRRMGVSSASVAAVEQQERSELESRAQLFDICRPGVTLGGRVVIVVDDGLATGSTARAACQVARAAGARRVVLAVPVAPSDWAQRLREVADEHVAVETHRRFRAVGLHYRDFSPTSDDEVVECLRSVAEQRAVQDPPEEPWPTG